jgi:hypothetical protein
MAVSTRPLDPVVNAPASNRPDAPVIIDIADHRTGHEG